MCTFIWANTELYEYSYIVVGSWQLRNVYLTFLKTYLTRSYETIFVVVNFEIILLMNIAIKTACVCTCSIQMVYGVWNKKLVEWYFSIHDVVVCSDHVY